MKFDIIQDKKSAIENKGILEFRAETPEEAKMLDNLVQKLRDVTLGQSYKLIPCSSGIDSLGGMSYIGYAFSLNEPAKK